MMFRPLSFDFPGDKAAENTEDQLLLGDQIMIAPVYRQNASGRYVYLPEEMMLIRMKQYNDYSHVILPAGHHYIEAGLDELVFFIRKGRAVPFVKPALCTKKLCLDCVTMIGYQGSSYTMYKDDGVSVNSLESFEITE